MPFDLKIFEKEYGMMGMKRYKQLLMKYFDEWIAGAFIAAAAIFLLVGMCSRICLHQELLWAEEAAMLCFVWAVCLGITAVYKREIHIGADMLVQMLSEDRKRLVRLLVRSILTAVNGILFWLSVKYTLFLSEKTLPVTNISCGWLGAALAFCFGLSTWYSLCSLLSEQKRGRKRGEA